MYVCPYVLLSVCQLRLGGNVIFSAPNWDGLPLPRSSPGPWSDDTWSCARRVQPCWRRFMRRSLTESSPWSSRLGVRLRADNPISEKLLLLQKHWQQKLPLLQLILKARQLQMQNKLALKDHGLKDADTQAQDRRKWRKIVSGLCSPQVEWNGW